MVPPHRCPGPGERAGTLREGSKRGGEREETERGEEIKGIKEEKERRVGGWVGTEAEKKVKTCQV